MPNTDRRSFLKQLAVSICAFASGLFALPTSAAAKKRAAGESWFRIGKLADFAEGTPTEIKKAHEVGGMKAISDPKLIATRRGNEVHVMSLACTHNSCKVKRRKDGAYQCPCHAATFDAAGKVLKGPATTPLRWLETRVTADGEVQVNTANAVPPPQ